MANQNKILLGQTLLLALISLLFLFHGIFSFYFFLLIIFFTPISIFYYGIIKNKNYVNLRWFNTIFKIYYWFLVSIIYILILGMSSVLIITENGIDLSGEYGLFINSALMIMFFLPMFLFYYVLLKSRENINLKWLNIAFKSFGWLLISTLLIIFIFGIYESFYMSWGEGVSSLTNVLIAIRLIDKEEIINFSYYYLPTLIFAGLLYWTIRVNKKFSI